MKSPDKALLDLATSSQNLQNRAAGNEQFSSADFGAWVTGLFDAYPMNNVLDICCGTGNQLVIYSKKSIASITGLDISEKSISKAKERMSNYKGSLHLVASAMEEFLMNSPSNSKDFISCFYGLYYSQNIKETCQQISKILSPQGHVLVCGPYGDNNYALFSLLEKYYKLPEFVTYSSSTFMQQTLAPELTNLDMTIDYQYFVNTISYPNTAALMQYLKSTTFFNDEYYDQIKSDLDKHFIENDSFDVEKHVMALIAKKS